MSSNTTDKLLRYKGFTIALSAAAGGLVLGAALGLTGVLDFAGDANAATLAAEAPIYECPFEASAGVLISGDRVFATGRDASGEWIEIRSPASSDARVWIRAAQLTPDTDLGSLPVIPCHEPATVVVETTTTIAGETTTTTVAITTTTSIAASTTTTTLPAAPSVGQVSTSRDPIWEENVPGQTCNLNPNQFTTTQIAAPITAPAGVGSVTMSWSVTTESGQKAMSLSAGQYRATLGPFEEEAVPQDESAAITVTVTVTDSLGRTASRNLIVTLEDCTFG